MSENGLDDAWVLHTRPYRNTSLIVELLSSRQGRVSAVARAGRRNSLLQPFVPLSVGLSGRNELRTLKAAEARGRAAGLQGEALYCGLYLNELLLRLLHRDEPQSTVMAAYEQALERLADDQLHRDVVLRLFELALLHELGYGFSLLADLQGEPLRAGQYYSLQPDQGLVADSRGRYAGDDLLAMSAGEWQESARRSARDLMREAFAPHLGDRPLASRELFRHGAKTRGESE